MGPFSWRRRLRARCKLPIYSGQGSRAIMIEREKVLAVLDKPRKLYSIMQAVNPSGSQEELHLLLLKMRDEGLVKFDIHKGQWSKNS